MYVLSENCKQISIESIEYGLKKIDKGGIAKIYTIANFSPELVVKVLYKMMKSN